MTRRECVQEALAHRSGRVPIDFGASGVSGMHISCVQKLREYYGLEPRPIRVYESYQMLGEIDDELKEAIGIDTIGLQPWKNFCGVENADWKEWRTPWGQVVLVPGGFRIAQDGEDIVTFPQGDDSVPASARMPSGGYFFDAIIRQPDFDEESLAADDNLEEYGPIPPEGLTHYAGRIRAVQNVERAAVVDFGFSALGDIAQVPATSLAYPKGIRDVTEWYVSLAVRHDLLHEIFDKQSVLAIENFRKVYEVVGDRLDVVYVCGTDFGTQTSQFCSTDTFDALFSPYYRRMNDWIHAHTPWKTFKHSCGAVADFMPSFIEAGFDIINPVQLSAAGMDPGMLKREYGKDLVFWGGGVDTQRTLPFGSPSEVRAEVLERCAVLSEGGGYVFDAIHNVQAKTPLENIVAMIDAVKEFNGES